MININISLQLANKTGISMTDFLIDVSKGIIPGHSIVHKFGQYDAVGTTFTPVTRGGIYLTPQVGDATTLRVKAGNTNDTAAGTGAREITLVGLDETGTEVTEVLATAGTSASSATTTTFIRLYRFYVSKSGTYATSSTGSHAGDIVIESPSAVEWGTIESTGFSRSQSEIGAYTIPAGYTGYLLGAFGFAETSKTTDLIFFKREGVLDTAPPYEAMRVVFEERVFGGEFTVNIKAPIKIGTGSDIGFLAKVGVGTAEIEIDFELLLVNNDYI